MLSFASGKINRIFSLKSGWRPTETLPPLLNEMGSVRLLGHGMWRYAHSLMIPKECVWESSTRLALRPAPSAKFPRGVSCPFLERRVVIYLKQWSHTCFLQGVMDSKKL